MTKDATPFKRGKDRSKDQSYFLFNLSQEQLAQSFFPLGEMEKPEVRRLAESIGLNVAGKSESHEICFIPDNDYAAFIAGQVEAEAFQPGNIVKADGEVLGNAQGLSRLHHRPAQGTQPRRSAGAVLCDGDQFG